MVTDLVSIVTPMYKGAAFIGETIRSVQVQTYSKWEMIIVDDCSPDDGAGVAVVKKFMEKDKRIRLIVFTYDLTIIYCSEARNRIRLQYIPITYLLRNNERL